MMQFMPDAQLYKCTIHFPINALPGSIISTVCGNDMDIRSAATTPVLVQSCMQASLMEMPSVLSSSKSPAKYLEAELQSKPTRSRNTNAGKTKATTSTHQGYSSSDCPSSSM